MSDDGAVRHLERRRREMEDYLQMILEMADCALADDTRSARWRSVRRWARRGLELPHDGTHGDDY